MRLLTPHQLTGNVIMADMKTDLQQRNRRWVTSKRYLTAQVVLITIVLAAWWLLTDRSRHGLSAALFWSGLLAVGLGVGFLCGAWRGMRETHLYYIRPATPERVDREFRYCSARTRIRICLFRQVAWR